MKKTRCRPVKGDTVIFLEKGVDADVMQLMHTAPIKDYGEFSFFPVFSGK